MTFQQLKEGKIYRNEYSEALYQFLGFNDSGYAEFVEVEYNEETGAYSFVDSDYTYLFDKFDVLDLID